MNMPLTNGLCEQERTARKDSPEHNFVALLCAFVVVIMLSI
jgi:hypothetical protein